MSRLRHVPPLTHNIIVKQSIFHVSTAGVYAIVSLHLFTHMRTYNTFSHCITSRHTRTPNPLTLSTHHSIHTHTTETQYKRIKNICTVTPTEHTHTWNDEHNYTDQKNVGCVCGQFLITLRCGRTEITTLFFGRLFGPRNHVRDIIFGACNTTSLQHNRIIQSPFIWLLFLLNSITSANKNCQTQIVQRHRIWLSRNNAQIHNSRCILYSNYI